MTTTGTSGLRARTRLMAGRGEPAVDDEQVQCAVLQLVRYARLIREPERPRILLTVSHSSMSLHSAMCGEATAMRARRALARAVQRACQVPNGCEHAPSEGRPRDSPHTRATNLHSLDGNRTSQIARYRRHCTS